MTRKSLQYISLISKSIAVISKGNLDENIPILSKDELGNLAGSINNMAQKLKSIEQAKNDLVTNISHDLRTPLTSVLGYLQLLKMKDAREKYDLYVDTALAKCYELKNMINDLLELSKLNSQEIKIHPTLINLGELINQVIMGFIPSLCNDQLEYRFDISDSQICIYADAALLARMFENIIANAIKYGTNGKYIDIVVKKFDEHISVKIINYGSIIPEKELNYVFGRFYRASNQKPDGMSSGLGLAIAKSIADSHGYELNVLSNNGRTEFECLC